MAADHITWAKCWNNGAFKSISSFCPKVGNFYQLVELLSLVSGALIAIFTNKQLKPLKVRLFLGFCYNSLKQ